MLPLATARDYKRIATATPAEHRRMGAHSPSGGLSAETAAEVVETVCGRRSPDLAAEGRPFVAVLYAGLMRPTGRGVLEFNARFGDPEAQVILLRMEDDLLPLLAAGAAAALTPAPSPSARLAADCVVLRQSRLSGRRSGRAIGGLDRARLGRGGWRSSTPATTLEDGER